MKNPVTIEEYNAAKKRIEQLEEVISKREPTKDECSEYVICSHIISAGFIPA